MLQNPNGSSPFISQGPLGGYALPPLAAQSFYLHDTAANMLKPEYFREAYFGLGLFFLISGFVIPLSLSGISPLEFIVRRFFRIYPTVIACVLIIGSLILLGRYMDGVHVKPFTIGDVFANALLMRDALWRPFIETALWSLEIEVHFYLICFLFAFFQGYKRASVLIAASLGFALTAAWFYPRTETLALNDPGAYKLATIVCENGAYITFMFVGTCLYNWRAGNWSGMKTAASVLVLMVVNNYCLTHIAATHAYAPYIYANHVSVLLFFGLLMLLNDRIPFSGVLNRIADISYPLYLMHGVAGFTVFFMAFKKTASFYASISAAAAWVVLSSLALNRFIEKPSIRLGKKIAPGAGSFLRLLPRRLFMKPKVFPLE